MNKNDFDEIITFAISNEIEAQEFYSAAAAKLADPFLKKLFSQFVIEEKKHQEILEGMRETDPEIFHFKSMPDYHVAETETAPEVSAAMTPTEAFALAMKNEEAAMKLYLTFAEAANDPRKKAVFEELAAMERQHKLKMENAFVDIGYPEVW